MRARCIVHTPINGVDVREIDVDSPGAGEVLVEAAYTCVSPGTELRCLLVEPQGEPYVPGYALAGHILQCGSGVDLPEGTAVCVGGTRRAGDLKLQWGGHVSHAIVQAEDICPLPPSVDLLDAAVARIGAIAFHGLRLSRPLAGENVAVVGLGLIGQLSARLHHLSGAHVVAADRAERRVDLARTAGIEAVVVAADATLSEAFAQVLPQGADLVVDTTGVPSVLPQALELGRTMPWDATPRAGLRYLVQGSYATDFTVPYDAAFQKETTLILPRSCQPRDLMATLELVASGRLVLRDLAFVQRPSEAPAAYESLRCPATAPLTIAFDWHSE